MTLEKYQQKRNFKKTIEPAGKISKENQNRFVVQKHHARNLHYDFRLELDGVLKSWAVPKGPPEKKSEKRLAVQTEDHPVSYINFEGEIPEGEYGAGTVEIWDKGKFKLLRREEKSLKFELLGEKLTGEYTLIQPKSFEEKNWLWIKIGVTHSKPKLL